MRYELEILEKIMYYDREGIISSFPLYVYRTKEKINRAALEAAVETAIQCHPLFGCRLAEDEKGPYLETNPEKPVIPELNPDREYYFGGETSNHYPWIVGIHENEIIYTGYHGLADGIGATQFMRTVLYYYFKEQGIELDPGKAVTLDNLTPEVLEKDTECTTRLNGGIDCPSAAKPSDRQPYVFPDEMLEETPGKVHVISMDLGDIKKKCAEFEVSQFAVLNTYLARTFCAVLPGDDDIAKFDIVADMRGLLNSATTHNCVMSVPIFFSKKELANIPDDLVSTMFRAKLDIGFNRDEALHSCFNSAQMEKQIGTSKEYLAGTADQIAKMYGFSLPFATIVYTHLTHTGFSDELFAQLDDVYINDAGYKKKAKVAIPVIEAVTTDKSVNMVMQDGTKNEMILHEFEKVLTDAGIGFRTWTPDKYAGVIYRR